MVAAVVPGGFTVICVSQSAPLVAAVMLVVMAVAPPSVALPPIVFVSALV
jgi:hypothetical protein